MSLVATEPSAAVLRVGLLLDGERVPAWIANLLERLLGIGDCRIVLIATSAGAPTQAPEDIGDWRRTDLSRAWQWWLRMERWRFPVALATFVLQTLPLALLDVDQVVLPAGTDLGDLPEAVLERFTAARLDVILQLGLVELGAALCRHARFGVWRLASGAVDRDRSGPPGFWEVVRGEATTQARVEVLTDPAIAPATLAIGTFISDRRSVLVNRAAHYPAAASLVVRELGALRRCGEAAFRARVNSAARAGSVAQSGTRPRAAGMASPGAALFAALRVNLRRLRESVRERFSRDQWILLFSFAVSDSVDLNFRHFARITPPKDRFWADPFVVHDSGRWYVFIEEFVYDEGRGVLAYIEISRDGSWTQPRRILELPYHLSYPQVFEHEGQWYMLPETYGARRIELYRAVEFPNRWEKERTLIDGIDAVDATLLQRDGKWWLFANVRLDKRHTHGEALWIFASDEPIYGAWTAHCGNPVVLDATSARPAGRFFSDGDRLLRPSQDGSNRYGYALKLNEVRRLDAGGYEECCIAHFGPGFQRDLVGVHTLSHANGLTVIDALRRHFR